MNDDLARKLKGELIAEYGKEAAKSRTTLWSGAARHVVAIIEAHDLPEAEVLLKLYAKIYKAMAISTTYAGAAKACKDAYKKARRVK